MLLVLLLVLSAVAVADIAAVVGKCLGHNRNHFWKSYACFGSVVAIVLLLL